MFASGAWGRLRLRTRSAIWRLNPVPQGGRAIGVKQRPWHQRYSQGAQRREAVLFEGMGMHRLYEADIAPA